MVRIFIKATVIFIFIFILGLSESATARMPVFVSIAPQKYFVKQIGKELVDVQVMVQPGGNPATYEPKPKQMFQISEAKLYFAIGVPFEKAWLKKIIASNPEMKVIYTDQGIDKIPMTVYHYHDEAEKNRKNGDPQKETYHQAHAENEHQHGAEILDPHIWLSPPLVKIQTRTMLDALREMDPSHQTVYEENYNQFVSRTDKLDADLRKAFAGKVGLQFMVFHPAWGYFAHAYGLEQVPIEIEGKDPKPAQLKGLIEHARNKGIKVIFVQPQFSTKSAKLVAGEIAGRVVFADPLAEDWMTNLREIAAKFEAALK